MKFDENTCDIVILISVCNKVCHCVLTSLEHFICLLCTSQCGGHSMAFCIYMLKFAGQTLTLKRDNYLYEIYA